MSISLLALALLQSSAEARAAAGLGPFSWLFMILSIGTVTTLTAWCFYRVLSTRTHFDPDGTGPAHPPVPGKVEQEQDDRHR
jgi:hypothetical protein